VANEFENLQAFNLDAWALKNGADKISLNESESNFKLLAALYYNLSTLYTLAGPSLRVATRWKLLLALYFNFKLLILKNIVNDKSV